MCRMLIAFFGAEQESERGGDVKKPSRPKNSAWDGEENGKRDKIAFPSFLQERIMRFARETQALRKHGKAICRAKAREDQRPSFSFPVHAPRAHPELPARAIYRN